MMHRPRLSSAEAEARAFGAKREAAPGHDAIAGRYTAQHDDLIADGLAQVNLALDEPSGLRGIGQVHHGSVAHLLNGRTRQDDRLAGRARYIQLDLRIHPKAKLLPRVRHLNSDAGGPRLTAHLRVDVRDLAGDPLSG